MSGHTPGPWDIITRPDGTMLVLTRDANGNPHKHIAEMSWATSESGEPDARLIAAAPELFTALEDFDNWFCGFNPEDQASRMEGRKVVIRARAALSKATSA